jgi:hypothetical protein
LTHNSQVDNWCEFQLSKLDGDPVTYEGIAEGSELEVEGLTKHILAPASLVLKVGARVMNLVNRDLPDDLGVPQFVANGQLGVVERMEDSGVRVRFDGFGAAISVSRFKWKWGHLEIPTFTQFPLRLAYAMTIHKCQGLTLEEGHLDVRAAREPGQTYVAFSRVRSLSGLSLLEWPRGLHVSPEAIAFHERLDRAPGYFEPGRAGLGPLIGGAAKGVILAEGKAVAAPDPGESQDEIPFEFSKPADAPASEPDPQGREWWRGGKPGFTGD